MSRVVERALVVVLAVPTPLRWLAVVGWAGVIFLASNQPGLAISDDPGVDKPFRHAAHVAVYAVLTTLVTWALSGPRLPSPRLALAGAALALLYGVTDEWHQTFVPTRSGRPEDLVWDGLGVVLGIGAIALLAAFGSRGGSPGG